MRKATMIVLAVLFVLSAACAHLTTETLDNSKKLKLGMTKEEAQKVMGEPYRSESYVAGEMAVESWYYLAGYGYYTAMGMDFIILDFESDKLVGWGRQH